MGGDDDLFHFVRRAARGERSAHALTQRAMKCPVRPPFRLMQNGEPRA
jgi:hypothetical protein